MNRIVSLLPGATEMVSALGATAELVGISHECDFPAEVQHLPRVTATPIDPEETGGRIDTAVRELVAQGRPVIAVDAELIRGLQPTHLITQALCDVCAVAEGATWRLADVLDPAPAVLNLTGSTLHGVWRDIELLGSALGRAEAGRSLSAQLAGRMDALAARTTADSRPRMLCLEWLDPPFTAGHWVPDLVRAAGAVDLGAVAGDHSAQRRWSDLRSMEPDLIVIMLCGMDVARSERELARLDDPDALAALSRVPVWILDGNSYTSRPGPRLVDGAERLAAALEGREMSGLKRWTGR
ncbi:MAG TPA: ABC transporter substrate-binding protein [Gemmatimonadales bacterium]|nr:ABC transporter substrate-binding protein [Gemmatimonadales bacterium]